uniref:Lysosomal dipeptide transporter MFSD1 n=1 Tax=Mucochytrium quahogii TaxID=96639 RepID=A0A7S2SL25_9STRA|mmetsp:Transcript_9136/g.17224  ORF Transcript_9136/g.17224 Transcript_9136/m.17224 type:complete len:561 (+) Transcript_9136:1775-3457(+)|eukprot:CAMPEP_0203753484 /NCGR_PEP_ID=MMETSP0098-20131031/7252_1 /ASSEMBLY_ACC=CAM_ASM_000208 /TAXON_ID=96639 /ORGANISM=" , Strain NY0313808BC1" /LENGTH=560 /DNA_ID=CAMNT_0050644103 /DNA_START=1394 /DNA_END=3076 /DNA_ORIENTATION=-
MNVSTSKKMFLEQLELRITRIRKLFLEQLESRITRFREMSSMRIPASQAACNLFPYYPVISWNSGCMQIFQHGLYGLCVDFSSLEFADNLAEASRFFKLLFKPALSQNSSTRMDKIKITIVEDDGPQEEKISLSNKDAEVLVITKYQYRVLFLVLLSAFSLYFAFDNPAPLYDLLQEYFDDSGPFQFAYFLNLLYSAVAIPNIILPPFVGPILDKYGMGKSFPLCTLGMVLSQTAVALGIEFKNQIIALIGRLFFAVSYQFGLMCCITLVTKWNRNRSVVGMSLLQAACRLGSVVTNLASVVIAKEVGVSGAFWVSVLLLVASFLPSLLMVRYERHRIQYMDKDNEMQMEQNRVESVWRAVIRKARSFSRLFWLTTFNLSAIYALVFGFNNIAASLIGKKSSHEPKEDISLIMSIPYCILIVLIPLIGLVMNRTGKLMWFTFVGFIIEIISFALLAFTDVLIEVPLVTHGIASALLMSSILPAVARSVDPQDTGTAFGIAFAAQNIAMTLIPVVVSALFSMHESYYEVCIFFMTLMCICIAVAGVTIWIDAKTGFRINAI